MKKHAHNVDPGNALLIIYLALMVMLVATNILTSNTDGLSHKVCKNPPAGQHFTQPPILLPWSNHFPD